MTYLKLARAVMKFDLSSIPSGVTIIGATLEIYKYGNYNGYTKSDVYEVYKVTKEWDENGASWIKRNSSLNWDRYGGDYESTALSSFSYDGSYNGWFDFSVTSAIKDFIDNPSINYGLIVLVPGGVDSVYDNQTKDQESYFHSSEASDGSLRPKLTVTYDPGTSTMQNDIKIAIPENYKVTIINMQGRKVASFMLNDIKQLNQMKASLSSGIHIINITTPEKKVVRKVWFMR